MAGNRKQRRTLRLLAVAVVTLLLVGGFVSFVQKMMNSKSSKSGRQVQIVQIIRPPPPPPPDQPPPPPPEKTQQQLPKDEPEPTPKEDEQAPPAALGLDADGSAGGDAFGLAARRGGSDLIGGNGTAAFAWYTNRLKDQIVEKLSADGHFASKKFSIAVHVWIDPDGRVKQVKLVSTTGDKELDQRIEAALESLPRLSEAPPLEMPQPVDLKIVSHS
jgi:periplasmic protein TonB